MGKTLRSTAKRREVNPSWSIFVRARFPPRPSDIFDDRFDRSEIPEHTFLDAANAATEDRRKCMILCQHILGAAFAVKALQAALIAGSRHAGSCTTSPPGQ
jgi:hypothetical protein